MIGFALAGLLGCVEDAEPLRIDDPEAWEPVPAEVDPLASHRPADVFCPVATFGPELGMFEVQTGACDYGAFAQPLIVDVRRGDRLVGTVWHDDLDAPEPAEAHVAVLLGDRLLWEIVVPLPGPANVHPFDVTLPEDANMGTPLGFHVHNHGFNSWRIAAVEWTAQ